MKPESPKFAKKNRETILPAKTALIINDISAILIFALAVAMIIMLLSYDSNDNCWFKNTSNAVINNKFGTVGAYVSDVLLSLFGVSSYLMPVGIFYLAYRKIIRNKTIEASFYNIIQFLSFIFLLIFAAIFEYVAFYYNSTSYLHNGFGGIVGLVMYPILLTVFGQFGSILLITLLITICFSIAFSVSLGTVAEILGAFLLTVYHFLKKFFKLINNSKNNLMLEYNENQAASHVNNLSHVTDNTKMADSNLSNKNSYLNSSKPDEVQDLELNKDHAILQDDNIDLLFDNIENNFNDDIDIIDDSNVLVNHKQSDLTDRSNNFDANDIQNNYDEDTDVYNASVEDDSTSNCNNKKSNNSDSKTRNLRKRNSLNINHNNLKNDNVNNTNNDNFSQNKLPSLSLLNNNSSLVEKVSKESIEFISNVIKNKLAEFGVDVTITNAESGPVITRYEILPASGVRGEKIVSLAKEIARALAITSVRVVETILGKNAMGIEVPNFKRQTICLKDIFESQEYKNSTSPLTLGLGKDISGSVVVADLAKMPHLLVAGTTGSGKSVAINTMILSILYKALPSEVKFIMIDPKMVELSFYQGIPHLLAPVVTDMNQAANALKWVVGEMERRYKIMAHISCKNISSFNEKVQHAIDIGKPIANPLVSTATNPTNTNHDEFEDDSDTTTNFDTSNNIENDNTLKPWPYIVVIIDELADLMMVAGKKIEQFIARIAQKARAVGIHLIVATQRPSVDVITGLIKANIPTRISFQVSSKIDSRTILDQMGAETLLGQGDSLLLPAGSGIPVRVHAAFITDKELLAIVEYLKNTGEAQYIDSILTGEIDPGVSLGAGLDDATLATNDDPERDKIFDEAVKFIYDTNRCAISSLQTRFGIGYNRAARIMMHLENIGMVQRNSKGAFELVKKV